MTGWLVLAGCLVVARLAWGLDNRARDAVEDARLKAILARERNEVRVEPDAVERLGPVALVRLNGQDPSRMREGAMAGLVADGLLRRTSPDGPARQRWVARGTLPKTADAFERELWRRRCHGMCATPPTPPATRRASTCGTCGYRTPGTCWRTRRRG
ncbi:hypothetical protein [Streptomyces hokutonensis]|uniref:hypothetical protein n=1 Tax=Streptomyces hokutonensis TaxID=1306990 RepID=UPI003675CAAE